MIKFKSILLAYWLPRIIILCLFGGRDTFFCANILIRFLTTSIPLASEAFNSKTALLYASPNISRAKHRMLDVFPTQRHIDKEIET